MDTRGDPLITRPIHTGSVMSIKLYSSWCFGCIENLVHQFGNGLVGTRTRTWSDRMELLLTLRMIWFADQMIKQVDCHVQASMDAIDLIGQSTSDVCWIIQVRYCTLSLAQCPLQLPL